uniref:Liver-expressed antimicrobial peptide 2 n=1 Tax=Geotrypetes seraphini TaxID=260995 RepID=A0A6P8QSM3_GEOSA|nr:liver-expressed antimicrobial peptide 2 [Geotrypetes seraphini]
MACLNFYAGQRVGFKITLAFCFFLLFCTSQICSSPISTGRLLSRTKSERGASVLRPRIVEEGLPSHHRFIRMTPFWRMVGSKPLGAYCVQDLECTTRICRKGHCAYNVPFES